MRTLFRHRPLLALRTGCSALACIWDVSWTVYRWPWVVTILDLLRHNRHEAELVFPLYEGLHGACFSAVNLYSKCCQTLHAYHMHCC